MSSAGKLFSVDHLEIFERHDATLKQREGRYGLAGFWAKFPNGWTLSVQWGAGNYGSNYDADFGAPVGDALTAEIAVWRDTADEMISWRDGDTVQGWCSMDRVQRVFDLLAADELVVDGVADDSRPEVAS